MEISDLMLPQLSDQLKNLLKQREGKHLEFKCAQQTFSKTECAKYCAALANDGGGLLVLGVGDKLPREIVGTSAFKNLDEICVWLKDKIGFLIEGKEYRLDEKRVVVFRSPPRPVGSPVQLDGAYWMRSGESLIQMPPERLKEVFNETEPDFSAMVCKACTINDLDSKAINKFRDLWFRKSGSNTIQTSSVAQLLTDAKLLVGGHVTYAALILMGTETALRTYLPQSEFIYEYRRTEAAGPASFRREFREGYFAFMDTLWETVNLRNDLYHLQEGFFIRDIPSFREEVIRELVNNAICHRDYHSQDSIFFRQYIERVECVSPGGLPVGVTLETLLDSSAWRNRRLAETLSLCGLVERAGQGVNLIFESLIKESKGLPDYCKTNEYRVFVTIPGTVTDKEFVKFLEKVGSETLASFSTADLVVLDYIKREAKIPTVLQSRLRRLLGLGVIERLGRTKGTHHILSKRFYSFVDKRGAYTRRRGLDEETKHQLLLKHLRNFSPDGAPLSELMQVLPDQSRSQTQLLLRRMRVAGLVTCRGNRKWARWHLGENVTIAGNED